MPTDPKLVQAVFLKAADLPPGDRAAVLDRECGGDGDLRHHVESLLAAHDRPDDLLATRLIHPPELDLPADLPAGACVGPYRLRQRLGEGGMGTVWAADQERPVKRRVAVKLIKPGMDSEQVIRRFEAERQALAMMDHPNIATILEAGVDDLGRPYFVMELVRGVPVTTYCDELNLGVRERLELFTPVCRAVQHAHQKGIIHRDIKPANVLVCIQDGRPVPKVIDFGIAKALERPLAEGLLSTAVGAVVGTVQYMSPEQAELSRLDVDTRADVYGLGGLLYELLTGTPPLDAARLRTAAFTETLRMIREDDPPRPSTRLSTADGPPVAGRTARAREVRGDLDWIVMKCLEKDRTRRYDSAGGLVRDVERYLNDEPVEARPPSTGYRLGKFVRRHRRAAAAGTVVLLALVFGLIGTGTGLVWAVRERDRAERRLAQVELGADILGSMFDDLNPQAADAEGRSLRVVLGRRLDQAAARLDADAVGDPLTVARLLHALGSSYVELGYPKKGVELLARARAIREERLGPRNPDTLVTRTALAGAYRDAGRLKDAVPLYEETLQIRREEFGPDDPRTLRTMNGLVVAYRDAGRPAVRPLAEEVHRRTAAVHGPKGDETLLALSSLATILRDVGELTEALALFRSVYQTRRHVLGPRWQETLRAECQMGITLMALGRAEEALKLHEEMLPVRRAELGPYHPETLGTMGEIAACHRRLGHQAEAIRRSREVLKLRADALGLTHPDTLLSMNNLAAALYDARETAEATALFEAAHEQTVAALDDRHPAALKTMCNLAAVRLDARDLAAATQLYTTALGGMRDLYDPDHPDLVACLGHLAETHLVAKRPAPALALLTEYLPVQRARLGMNDPRLADVLDRVGRHLSDAGQHAEAEPVYREGLAIRTRTAPGAWRTAKAAVLLGFCLDLQDKSAEASTYLARGYDGLKRLGLAVPPEERALLPKTAEWLADLYRNTRNGAEEARWRTERASYPPD